MKKEDTRTIRVGSSFGTKNVYLTKEQFVERWTSPALTVWTFFLDHADSDDAGYGQEVYNKVREKAAEVFERFYADEQEEASENMATASEHMARND